MILPSAYVQLTHLTPLLKAVNHPTRIRLVEDSGWVCKEHPQEPWQREYACGCGSPGPCPECNVPEGDDPPRPAAGKIEVDRTAALRSANGKGGPLGQTGADVSLGTPVPEELVWSLRVGLQRNNKSNCSSASTLTNGLKPPTPKYPAWLAYAIVFPLLGISVLTSLIWMGAYGCLMTMKAIKKIRRQVYARSSAAPSLWRERAEKTRTMAERCFAEGERLLEISAAYELLAERVGQLAISELNHPK